jgi:hypothetical protein
MPNPYAFGQKDYSTLDRRRQMIDESLKSSFDTNNAIAQMQQRKDQQDKIKAIASTYQSAMNDNTLTPEQKVDLSTKHAMAFSGLGDKDAADNAMRIGGVYAGMQRVNAKPDYSLEGRLARGEINADQFRALKFAPQKADVITPYQAEQLKLNQERLRIEKEKADRERNGKGDKVKEAQDKLRNELIRKKEVAQTVAVKKYPSINLKGIISGKEPVPQIPNPKGLTDDKGVMLTIPDPDVMNYLKTLKDAETEFSNQGVGFTPTGIQETEQPVTPANQVPQRTIKRTGTANGKKVVEYTDGTIEYQ